jgi:hypothetical protein
VKIKKFSIPELPLPLNNTLMQEVVASGKHYYITAGYSNFEPVLLVFDDLGEFKTIKLPHDYSGPLAPYQGKLICGHKKWEKVEPKGDPMPAKLNKSAMACYNPELNVLMVDFGGSQE